MPAWFVNLAYVVFAAVMVCFLAGLAAVIIVTTVVSVREYLRGKRKQ